MFKMLIGMVISYGVFNEEGRKIMNSMGNKLIEVSKTKLNKEDTNDVNNKSSNSQPNGDELSWGNCSSFINISNN